MYLVLFLRFSASKNGVTLKPGAEVVKSLKRRHSIDNIRLSGSRQCKYSSVHYHFRVMNCTTQVMSPIKTICSTRHSRGTRPGIGQSRVRLGTFWPLVEVNRRICDRVTAKIQFRHFRVLDLELLPFKVSNAAGQLRDRVEHIFFIWIKSVCLGNRRTDQQQHRPTVCCTVNSYLPPVVITQELLDAVFTLGPPKCWRGPKHFVDTWFGHGDTVISSGARVPPRLCKYYGQA